MSMGPFALEPTRPLEGVASPAPDAPLVVDGNVLVEPQRLPYTPRPLDPRRMWAIVRMVSMIRKDATPLQLAQYLVPRGFPGSGVFRGRDNVAKTVTYRATYVPGGFNRERNQWRELMKSGEAT